MRLELDQRTLDNTKRLETWMMPRLRDAAGGLRNIPKITVDLI